MMHSNYVHCLIYGDQFKNPQLEEFARRSRELSISNMAESLGEKQFEEFKKAFSMFDKDGDGVISRPELAIVIKSLTGKHPSELGIKNMIKEVDEDGDGGIDMSEFLQMMVSKCMKARNYGVLDKYAEGWAKGDSSLIHATLDKNYTYAGIVLPK